MTEREKMLSGALYASEDPELAAARIRARTLCGRLNQTPPEEREAQEEIIRRLFASVGENSTVNPVFWCDYGSNITAGDNFYVNYNCVILDCAPVTFGDNVYLVPEETPELTKIRVLRPGLQAGTLKKGRMEPAHALALFLKKEDVFQWAELGTGETAAKYLRGEAIGAGELEAVSGGDLKGWVLMTVDGFSLGFAKADRGVLKNHYPKGLRRP